MEDDEEVLEEEAEEAEEAEDDDDMSWSADHQGWLERMVESAPTCPWRSL